jgi:basic amino acid/polyamine antiporter, APA family
MTSFGTLFAFIIVCIGVLVLRRTRPELARPFRTPWVPFIPIAGILVCLLMLLFLPANTWIIAATWLVVGYGVYFGYSRRRTAAVPLPAE